MSLIGNGIQNGSPFYAGYEVTPFELGEAPQGLLTYMTYANPKAAASTGKTSDKEEVNRQYVPGIEGTRNSLVSSLDNIDAAINSTKAQMNAQFGRDNSPTHAIAIQKIGELGLDKKLTGLIADRNAVQANIPNANQELEEFNKIDKAYEKNPEAQQEPFIKKVNGVLTIAGSNGKGDILTYGAAKNQAYNADNTVKNDRGLPVDVNIPDYSQYAFGVSQSGALKETMDADFKDIGNTEGGTQQLDSDTGLIKGYKSGSNLTQLYAAAGRIKSNLSLPAQADLAAQTALGVNNKDKNVLSLLSPEEIEAVKKSKTDNSNLTKVDTDLIATAQDKVLTAKINNAIPQYIMTTSESTVNRGTAAGKKEKPVIDYLTNQEHNVMSSDGKTTYTFTSPEEYNFSENPVKVTTATAYNYDAKTGKFEPYPVGETKYDVYGAMKVPLPGGGETTVGMATDADRNDTYVPYDGNVKKRVETEFGVELNKENITRLKAANVVSGKTGNKGTTNTSSNRISLQDARSANPGISDNDLISRYAKVGYTVK